MPDKVIASHAVSGAISMRGIWDAPSVVPGWIARGRDGTARTGAGPARPRAGRAGR